MAGRRTRARETVNEQYSATGCKEIADFRDLIARKDIDAVVISTPDHWHVPISLMALEAGKDVFCEKPTLTIAEGRKLVETVARHKAVFQVGIEDRSVIYYYRMAELRAQRRDRPVEDDPRQVAGRVGLSPGKTGPGPARI